MKKLVALVSFVVITVLVAKKLDFSKEKVNSLLLYNIEALAADETIERTRCLGVGTVDCPSTHDKVEYVLEGYSLEKQY